MALEGEKPKRGRPGSPEKERLRVFVLGEYGLDAAKGSGFEARLSLADLRRLKEYADRARVALDGRPL